MFACKGFAGYRFPTQVVNMRIRVAVVVENGTGEAELFASCCIVWRFLLHVVSVQGPSFGVRHATRTSLNPQTPAN